MKDLSLRLSRIAGWVSEGSTVADIGSDHGLLPIFLVQADRIVRAIAVEVAEGPFQVLSSAVEDSGYKGRIDTRFGSGLDPIADAEVDAVILAGMGGHTIWDILTTRHAQHVLASAATRLLIQPMNGSGLVRYYAEVFGYQIREDVRVLDGGVCYECLFLMPGSVRSLTAEDIVKKKAEMDELGPLDRMKWAFGEKGLAMQCSLLSQTMKEEYEKRARALKQLAYPMGDRAQLRAEELRAECGALLQLYEQYFSARLSI